MSLDTLEDYCLEFIAYQNSIEELEDVGLTENDAYECLDKEYTRAIEMIYIESRKFLEKLGK